MKKTIETKKQPLKIYRSKLYSVIIMFGFLAFIGLGISMLFNEALLLGILAVLIGSFAFYTELKNINKKYPILIISKEGIQFEKSEVYQWEEIETNIEEEINYRIPNIRRLFIIRFKGIKYEIAKVNILRLAISPEKLLHEIKRYRGDKPVSKSKK